MKKITILKIVENVIQWIPIGVYAIFNLETFYSSAEKGITISSVIVIGAILMFLKDKVKAWLSSPSAFKYIALMWVISLIFIVLGNRIFVVSSILLASQLAALPIDAWKNALEKDEIDQESIKKLTDMLSGKQ